MAPGSKTIACQLPDAPANMAHHYEMAYRDGKMYSVFCTQCGDSLDFQIKPFK